MNMAVEVSRERYASDRVPPDLDGVRMAHISDLHFRSTSPGSLQRVVEALADFDPHLLLFTGDAVVHDSYWPQVSVWLKSLCPGARKFCVPGNWDYKYGWGGRFERAMDDAGFEMLMNRSTALPFGSSILQVVGLDDVRMGYPDPQAAWKEVDGNAFTLALAHSPDTLMMLDAYPLDLLLCGHTHGGQICLPAYGAIITSTWLGRPYAQGRHDLPERGQISVSRGLGEGHIRLRLFCRRQVSLFTLQTMP